MAGLTTLIGRPSAEGFRRASIKRRLSTGLYESTWVDITRFVKDWGTVEATVDDIRLNRFTYSGVTLRVRNDEGKFNSEANPSSLWYTYLTRYKTLIRVEAGYYDEDGSELPTDTTQGIFTLDGEVEVSAATNDAILNCKSLASIFDSVRAENLSGVFTTQTASDIIAKIRDYSDGAGNLVFRQFITSTAWLIQSTTINYNLATTTALQRMTTWDLMTKIAEAEGFILIINRSGGLEFRDRDERSSTSTLDLYGQGFPRPNIIRLYDHKEALDKFYNYFRFKFKDADTTTSYVTAGTATSIDPSNTSWRYDPRVYEFDNDFFANTATAQLVVAGLFDEFGELKEELTVDCKFLPQVEISDRVDLYYRSYRISADTTLWDSFIWGLDAWADESGENFDWFAVAFKVLSRRTDLDRMVTRLRVRKI